MREQERAIVRAVEHCRLVRCEGIVLPWFLSEQCHETGGKARSNLATSTPLRDAVCEENQGLLLLPQLSLLVSRGP